MLCEQPGVHIPLRAKECGALAGRPGARLEQSNLLAASLHFVEWLEKKNRKSLLKLTQLSDQIFVLFHFGSLLNNLSASKMRL